MPNVRMRLSGLMRTFFVVGWGRGENGVSGGEKG